MLTHLYATAARETHTQVILGRWSGGITIAYCRTFLTALRQPSTGTDTLSWSLVHSKVVLHALAVPLHKIKAFVQQNIRWSIAVDFPMPRNKTDSLPYMRSTESGR